MIIIFFLRIIIEAAWANTVDPITEYKHTGEESQHRMRKGAN